MYFLIGKNELLKNSLLLAKLNAKNPLNAQNARSEFLDFIQSKQSKNPVYKEHDPQWIYKEQSVGPYISLFSEKSIVNDMQQESVIALSLYKESEAKNKIDRTKSALLKLNEQLPDLYELFRFNIHTVFSAPSNVAGGGSTSGAIGVIWSNPKDHWTISDIVELLVHEFTHNAMFIDELCYGHYTRLKRLTEEVNFPVSAILKKKRPLDKVLHALAVSTEVLSFRHFTSGHPEHPLSHPKTETLIEQTLESIKSIKELKNFNSLLTPRGFKILELSEKRISTIKNDLRIQNDRIKNQAIA